MQIKIKNLKAVAIIGTNNWEREVKQDVVINITMDFDGSEAVEGDDLSRTIDYKDLARMIITEVEKTSFYLLEKLADYVLGLVMENRRVKKATVEIDKPRALRHSDSVSVTCSRSRV